MNIQKFKRSLYVALTLNVLVFAVMAVRVWRQEDSAQDSRYYGEFERIPWGDRKDLAANLRTRIRSGLNAPEEYAAVYHDLTRLDMAEQRSISLWEDLPFDTERTTHPRLRKTDPALTSQLHTEMGQSLLKIFAAGYTREELDKVMKPHVEAGEAFSAKAHQIAGPLNWSRIWAVTFWWLALTFFSGGVISAAVYFCRAKQHRINPLLLIFDPQFWAALVVWKVGVFRYLEHVDVVAYSRRVVRFAAGVLCTIISAGAGGMKVFGQDKKDESSTGASGSTMVINPPKTFSYTLDGGIANLYHGHFVGANFHKGVVGTLSLTVAHNKTGLSFIVWTSMAATNRFKGNNGNEIDLSVDLTRKVLKDIDAGVNFNYIQGTPLGSPIGDVGTLALRLGKKYNATPEYTYEPFLWTRYSMPVKHGGPEKGWVVEAGANHRLKIRKCFNVGGTTSLIWDSGPFGFNPGAHVNFSAAAEFALSDRLTLVAPSGKFTAPLTRSGDGRHPMASVSAGFRITF